MSVMTAENIIRQALLKIEAVGFNDIVSTQLKSDGLIALNNLISSWSAEGLNIPYITLYNSVLTVDKASYTIGSGGDFNTTRPIQIRNAFIRDSSDNDYPVTIKSILEYAKIVDKTVTGRPYWLFYNPEWTLGKIYLYPVPDDTESLHLDMFVALSEISVVTDNVNLPNEYKRALIYNLAVELSSTFNTENLLIIKNIADESKRIIKALNIKPLPVLSVDNALIGSGARYNIYTDSYN